MDVRGFSQFGIMSPETRQGENFAAIFREEVLRRGGEVVAEQSYLTDQTDFRYQVRLLQGLDPNVPDEEEQPKPTSLKERIALLQKQQMEQASRHADAAQKKEKVKELTAFIQRFSSNASKARQATSRKKLLDKLTLDDIPVSSRKYPWIAFRPERPCGSVILEIDNLSKTIDGEKVLNSFSMVVNGGDKIAFVGNNSLAKTALFRILAGETAPDAGSTSAARSY